MVGDDHPTGKLDWQTNFGNALPLGQPKLLVNSDYASRIGATLDIDPHFTVFKGHLDGSSVLV